jgi:hypothetical protein
LLDWLRVEYGLEKPSNKLLAETDLDSDTWVGEVKRICGKKQPLSSAGLHALRDVKGSVHENVIFSQAAVRFLIGQPWRNKHGKASPLAWFALRGARVSQSLGRHASSD